MIRTKGRKKSCGKSPTAHEMADSTHAAPEHLPARLGAKTAARVAENSALGALLARPKP